MDATYNSIMVSIVLVKTSDFNYSLPPELIAQTPHEPRDHSRLLVAKRRNGHLEHRYFYDLVDYLESGDVLVLNDSRVLPAGLLGHKKDTGGAVELLLLRRVRKGLWECLAKPSRSLKIGQILVFREDSSLQAEVVEVLSDGVRVVQFSDDEAVQHIGQLALPPYIKEPLNDPERYQTVYSKEMGSVAAPTAGLHFTPNLLDRCRQKGVELVFVTLHIGLDTFRPVRTENPAQHKLHNEYWEISSEAAETLNAAKKNGQRIISVGTTSTRVLEQAYQDVRNRDGQLLLPASGWADLFILPGYRFRLIDAMVTNFHLPRTTLLMLVCAFTGQQFALEAYAEAVRERYRFYSFGDGMLIL